jgi:hypothetical protein
MDVLHNGIVSKTENNPQISIDEIPNEILLHIFSLNANMADDDFFSCEPHYRALNVTRRTSQVSRRWRNIALGTPSIWANVIDLDIFRMDTARDWREEVLRRSGNSLLSVKGYLIPSGGNWNFVEGWIIFSFLDKYWDRIQNLKIQFTGSEGTFDNDDWLRILCRPSPLLRSFDLQVTSLNLSRFFITFSYPDAVLFSGHAPSLREFHKGSIITLTPAPWLYQLRILELNFENQSTPPTIARILRELEGMRVLERLIIHMGGCRWRADNRGERIRRVKFPSLRHLDITSSDFKHCALLLKNIVPQQRCSLFLNACGLYDNREYTPPLYTLVPLIAQYSNNYFNFGGIVPRSIEFRLFNHLFQFAAYVESWSFTPVDISGLNYPDRANKPQCPDADFNVEVMDNPRIRLGLTLLRPIISSIPVPALGLVTAFKLFISKRYLINQKVDLMVFLPLMESLISVETLATTTNSLKELTAIGIGNSTLPSLRTLTMMGSLSKSRKDSKEYVAHPIILDFLQLRAEAGLPIEVFDLRSVDEDPRCGKISLQCLEVMSGLKVVWRGGENICEYVCGSGNPGILNFTV